MNSWERFAETSLPDKKYFYSELISEGITDKDYAHAQKVGEVFEINNLGEYHNQHVQCDTLLLPDVFEKFRDTCIEIYELDPSHILSVPGLAWQANLKKTNIELELLTDVHMSLMIEEGIRFGMCQSAYRYAKANNEYTKNSDKSIGSSYLMSLYANNQYGWALSQKLPVNGFRWVYNVSGFNERFIKNYNENSDIGYFLEVDVENPKKLFGSHKDLPFYQIQKNQKKQGNLFVVQKTKKNMSFT